MPAYSFKERFIPLIKSGEKQQTIRSKRKRQAKPGDIVYLYFGMRSKWCKKIAEGVCTKTARIKIFKHGTVQVDGKILTPAERVQFAIDDGFFYQYKDGIHTNAWDAMFEWWKQNNELPFIGDIIYWKSYPIVDEHRLYYIHWPKQIDSGKWIAVSVLLKGGHLPVSPASVEFETERECLKACVIHNRYHGWTKNEVFAIVIKSFGLKNISK